MTQDEWHEKSMRQFIMMSLAGDPGLTPEAWDALVKVWEQDMDRQENAA